MPNNALMESYCPSLPRIRSGGVIFMLSGNSQLAVSIEQEKKVLRLRQDGLLYFDGG